MTRAKISARCPAWVQSYREDSITRTFALIRQMKIQFMRLPRHCSCRSMEVAITDRLPEERTLITTHCGLIPKTQIVCGKVKMAASRLHMIAVIPGNT